MGITHTPEYRAWQTIKAICYCKSRPEYKLYGAKGVRVSAEWLATELQTLAFPNNTQDQVIRLSDLEKIVGEG